MTARTPEQAQEWLCPLSRTFAATPAIKGCQGPSCAVWRWQQHTADAPEFKAAVSAKMKDIGKGPGGHKEAVAWVMENRETLGIPTQPTHGFCGMGGAL